MERPTIVSIDSDSVGALRRLRRSMREAGIELPPMVATRAVVRNYGEGLMDLAYALSDRPATPISELDALGYLLAEHDISEELRTGIRRHYKRLYPQAVQKNIYPAIIA